MVQKQLTINTSQSKHLFKLKQIGSFTLKYTVSPSNILILSFWSLIFFFVFFSFDIKFYYFGSITEVLVWDFSIKSCNRANFIHINNKLNVHKKMIKLIYYKNNLHLIFKKINTYYFYDVFEILSHL